MSSTPFLTTEEEELERAKILVSILELQMRFGWSSRKSEILLESCYDMVITSSLGYFKKRLVVCGERLRDYIKIVPGGFNLWTPRNIPCPIHNEGGAAHAHCWRYR